MTARSVASTHHTAEAAPTITRADASWVLVHAGIDPADVAELLAGVTFPATLDDVIAHGQRRGITPGALSDRLGGSP